MKMPNRSACARSCSFFETHVAMEATIETRPATSETSEISFKFSEFKLVFIGVFYLFREILGGFSQLVVYVLSR
jgi:hypothetical protein